MLLPLAMRVDRSHLPWVIFVLLATAAATLLYVANFHPHALPFPLPLPPIFGNVPPVRQTYGGTPLGLALGTLAYGIFFFASALGIRKKRPTLPGGAARFWLRGHLWLSVLTLPLVLLHSGFHLGGAHSTGLMILYSVVMISGVYGLVLQQFMPRLMKERLPREVVFEQIPHVRALLRDATTALRATLRKLQEEHARDLRLIPAAGASSPDSHEPANTFYDPSIDQLATAIDRQVLPYLSAARGDRLPLGSARGAFEIFRTLKLNVAHAWHAQVDELQAACDERRMMDLQTRYQHWLHSWLFIHVPLSFTLLVFTGWHAWIEWRFLTTLR